MGLKFQVAPLASALQAATTAVVIAASSLIFEFIEADPFELVHPAGHGSPACALRKTITS